MKFLKLTLAFFALFISAAHAQIGVDAGAFSGGTVTNPIIAPSINSNAYQISGASIPFGILLTSTGAPTNGGSGYAVGDTITLSAGTCSQNPIVSVTAVSTGVITNYITTLQGYCTVPSAGALAQASTSGSGTGAKFTPNWGPYSANIPSGDLTHGGGNFAIGGNGGGGFAAGGALIGGATEDTFAGYGAGGAVTTGGFETAFGHNALGVGGGCPITGSNNSAFGDDALRNLCVGAGNTAVGSSALKTQSDTNSGANLNTAVGSGSLQFLNANFGTTYDTAIGSNSCPGVNGTAIFYYGTCLGGLQGAKLTTASRFTLIGLGAGNNTFASGTAVLLISSGNVTVDTPAAGTSNYINVENVWTATGTNTPSTSATAVAGTLTVSGITTDATHTDATVCEDTTTHQFYFGSGTLGICLGTSSLRYKRDWKPLDDVIPTIRALKPGNFFYKQGFGDNGAKEQYGFLAEDTVSVLPNLTGLDAEGKPNSVDILGMVPVIVKAMQQQQLEIDAVAAHQEKSADDPLTPLKAQLAEQQTEIYILYAALIGLAIWCSGLTFLVVRNRSAHIPD